MTGFSSRIFLAQAHGNDSEACISGIFLPELFSCSRILVDLMRLDVAKLISLSFSFSMGLVVRSYRNVVGEPEISEVGGSVTCVRSISLLSSSLVLGSSF